MWDVSAPHALAVGHRLPPREVRFQTPDRGVHAHGQTGLGSRRQMLTRRRGWRCGGQSTERAGGTKPQGREEAEALSVPCMAEEVTSTQHWKGLQLSKGCDWLLSAPVDGHVSSGIKQVEHK